MQEFLDEKKKAEEVSVGGKPCALLLTVCVLRLCKSRSSARRSGKPPRQKSGADSRRRS
jgi:hypothetical protein